MMKEYIFSTDPQMHPMLYITCPSAYVKSVNEDLIKKWLEQFQKRDFRQPTILVLTTEFKPTTT